jgi:hypothetical protein
LAVSSLAPTIATEAGSKSASSARAGLAAGVVTGSVKQ